MERLPEVIETLVVCGLYRPAPPPLEEVSLIT